MNFLYMLTVFLLVAFTLIVIVPVSVFLCVKFSVFARHQAHNFVRGRKGLSNGQIEEDQ